MRDFNGSLRPDATNPVIIVVPDRLAAYAHIAKLWLFLITGQRDADFCCRVHLNNTTALRAKTADIRLYKYLIRLLATFHYLP
jgi:hypothetical protein